MRLSSPGKNAPDRYRAATTLVDKFDETDSDLVIGELAMIELTDLQSELLDISKTRHGANTTKFFILRSNYLSKAIIVR